MADRPFHAPEPDPLHGRDAEAFLDRAMRYLDDLLDAEEVGRFNAELAASAARREAFVRLCELRGHLFEHRLTRAAEAPVAGGDDDAMGPAEVPPPWFERLVEPEAPRRSGWRVAAAILLPMLLGVALYATLRPGPPAVSRARTTAPVVEPPTATLVASARAQWAPVHSAIELGRAMPAGPLELRSGLVEIYLKNGVSLIVQAPAKFHVQADAMGGDLELGKITATVPAGARGFAIRTATATIVDFGTEFGVEVRGDRATRVEVFQGAVEAQAVRPADPAQAKVTLTKDQAAEVAADAAAVTSVPPSTDVFVRDIAAARLPLPAHNTGVRLREGEADPAWLFVPPAGDPVPAPRPAVVCPAVPNRYAPNAPEASQWISTAAGLPELPEGAYTFRTTLDLTGFDPATASVTARVWVDNYVSDVRVNGKSTGAATPIDRANTETVRTIAIPAEFSGGVNQVEFVVYNELQINQGTSPTALRVEWDATAAPRVAR